MRITSGNTQGYILRGHTLVDLKLPLLPQYVSLCSNSGYFGQVLGCISCPASSSSLAWAWDWVFSPWVWNTPLSRSEVSRSFVLRAGRNKLCKPRQQETIRKFYVQCFIRFFETMCDLGVVVYTNISAVPVFSVYFFYQPFCLFHLYRCPRLFA